MVVTQNYARFPPASSTVPAFTGAPPAKRLKTLAKSSSTSNISASTGAPGSLPASTSNRNLAAAAAVAPAVTAPIPAAPSSSAGSVHITNNNNANKSSKPIPDNFYEIVKPIFQREFVEIEYDDVKVNCAFFAKIMYSNCRDYGMEHFAPDPMNFDIINEKLAKKQYRSVDEFLSDFHTVLKNIVTYFPMDHPARKEVDVVREKFDSHWQHMQHRFKW